MGRSKANRLAIIDLGTNSVRFDVHELHTGGTTTRLHREKQMIRLGDGVYSKGKIQSAATRRTLRAFTTFKAVIQNQRVSTILAFGTSALRTAKNKREFISTILKKTGIAVRVISGKQEARLIARGILPVYQQKVGFFALIDIGGGSTEVSLCRSGKVLHSESLPLGVARLQQLYLKGSPPSPAAILELRQHIAKKIKDLFKGKRIELLIASSGTARALDLLSRKMFSTRLNYGVVRELSASMGQLTRRQLFNLPGMEPKRVDFILAGSILFEEIVAAFGCPKIEVTKLALRDGILQEYISAFFSLKKKEEISLTPILAW